MVWHPFSKECQLKDRLSEYGVKLDGEQQPANATRARKLYILVFGDSVDRHMLQDACEIGNGTHYCVHEFDSACAPPSTMNSELESISITCVSRNQKPQYVWQTL